MLKCVIVEKKKESPSQALFLGNLISDDPQIRFFRGLYSTAHPTGIEGTVDGVRGQLVTNGEKLVLSKHKLF